MIHESLMDLNILCKIPSTYNIHVSDLQRHIQSILWHPSRPEHQGPRSVWSSHHHPSQQTGN